MGQLMVLSLGSGSCETGFQTVTAQLWSGQNAVPTKFSASLEPAPHLLQLYQRWRSLYGALSERLNWRKSSLLQPPSTTADSGSDAQLQAGLGSGGIELDPSDGPNRVSEKEFQRLCKQLETALNQWLQSPSFATLDQRLRTQLDASQEIRIIIETDDIAIRRLPWHLWNLVELCPQAEIAVSALDYARVDVSQALPRERFRILAILGDSQGIDIQQDRLLLEQLPDAEVIFLSEPTRPMLDQWLWDRQGWDLLFFAGHSTSESQQDQATTGKLFLNPGEEIELEQLRHALKAAIARGLKLAIFNSCDGLGLAQSLESLNLPQLIVMSEPVPDRVAQTFLKNLLQALASGQAFYPAARQAREQLQGLEGEFPCASWLPTICQNPAAPSFVWPGSCTEAASQSIDAQATIEPISLAQNPYQGLAAFLERDSDRYFGRSSEIQSLMEQFSQLHQTPGATRLFPIYGPSGSGKSSLARAGLLAKLRAQPSPAQIVVFVPGSQPLRALAKALANLTEQEKTSVRIIRELSEELQLKSNQGNYDGLQRIAHSLEQIETHPLILLIDQFEEVYSLCEDEETREIFIENLLHAAQHPSRQVAVIVTFRSDFLRETHQHPELNRLFATQGCLVPVMNKENLREAIARPAQQAGHPLDDATVSLLIEQTEGRDGALPLLQFALTRIWEGFAQGKPSAQTLQEIGGVGGALAEEAQRIYDGLSELEQDIARRLFLGLVQLGEGTRDTRRRTSLDELISQQDDAAQVRQVLNQFAAPGVRLITLTTIGTLEAVEVTHEALFDHWQQLTKWLDAGRDDLRFQRRLDEAAKDWQKKQRADGLLWRKPNLDLLRNYYQRCGTDMTPLQMAFFTAAQKSEQKQRRLVRIATGALLLLTAGMAGFGVIASRNAVVAQRERQVSLGRKLVVQANQLTTQDTVSSKEAGALLAIKALQLFRKIDVDPPFDIDHAMYAGLANPNIVLAKHTDWVNDVAFTPSGKLLATASGDKNVHLWNIQSRDIIATFPHQTAVNRVVIHPDGKTLATASDSEIAHLWDLESKESIAALPHHSFVRDIAFHPQGTKFATATENGKVHIWDWKKQQILMSLTHQNPVKNLAFNHKGDRLATSSNNIVKVWDVNSKKELTSLEHTAQINDILFSPDGSTLATADAAGEIKIWDVNAQKHLFSFTHKQAINQISFSPDGRQLASGSNDETIKIWDLSTGDVLAVLPQGKYLRSIEFSPDGQTIAAGSIDDVARIWNLAKSQEMNRFRHSSASFSALFDSKGNQFIAVSGNVAYRWNLETRSQLAKFQHEGRIVTMDLSSDGTRLVTGSFDKIVRIWNAKTGEMLHSLPQDGPLFSVAFSPDGRQVATGGTFNSVSLWDSRTGKLIHQFPNEGSIYTLEFSPDGSKIMMGGSDNTANIWDLQSREKIRTLPYHSSVTGIDFSSDSERVAIATANRKTYVLDLSKNEVLGSFLHDDTVMDVEFNFDDTQIITSSEDYSARIWEIKTGKLLTSFPHEGGVVEASFNPDGSKVITASRDQSVRIWSYYNSSDELADETCKYLNHGLSSDDWESYIGESLDQYELICEGLTVHPSVLAEAKRLAESGQRKEAVAIYRRVLKLDSQIDLDPSTETLEQDPIALSTQQEHNSTVQ